MSLDADVAAVVDGSRPHVRGILRLPARPPPSYSAIAARQTTPPTHSSTPSTPQPTTAAATQPSWHTVGSRRRGSDRLEVQAAGVVQSRVESGGVVVGSDVVTVDASRAADGTRRRKKKAGEPPPPNLHFAELIEAQLRRVEEKKEQKKNRGATDTADSQTANTTQPATSATVSGEPNTVVAADHNVSVTPSSRPGSRKRAKPTKLKRQLREQQLHAFIRDHILTPIVRAAVAQANSNQPAAGTEALEGGVDVERAERERVEREKREKRRMLRHIKRKQKRLDKQTATDRSTSQSNASQLLAHDVAAEAGDAEEEEKDMKQTEEEEDGKLDDGLAAVAVDSLLPRSQSADADEDPSCPTQPYSFTDDERAFLFQHVVVDRYHSQPPLSPTRLRTLPTTLHSLRRLTRRPPAARTRLLPATCSIVPVPTRSRTWSAARHGTARGDEATASEPPTDARTATQRGDNAAAAGRAQRRQLRRDQRRQQCGQRLIVRPRRNCGRRRDSGGRRNGGGCHCCDTEPCGVRRERVLSAALLQQGEYSGECGLRVSRGGAYCARQERIEHRKALQSVERDLAQSTQWRGKCVAHHVLEGGRLHVGDLHEDRQCRRGQRDRPRRSAGERRAVRETRDGCAAGGWKRRTDHAEPANVTHIGPTAAGHVAHRTSRCQRSYREPRQRRYAAL